MTEDDHPFALKLERKLAIFAARNTPESWEKDKGEFYAWLDSTAREGLRPDEIQQINPEETKLIWRMALQKELYLPFTPLYTTVLQEISKPKFDDDGNYVELAVIAVGTVVRINMLSRFGDVGITANLNAEAGYTHRISPLSNRLAPAREVP